MLYGELIFQIPAGVCGIGLGIGSDLVADSLDMRILSGIYGKTAGVEHVVRLGVGVAFFLHQIVHYLTGHFIHKI